jgi:hypothetical protein
MTDKQAIMDNAKLLDTLETYTLEDFEKALDRILTAQGGKE